MWPYGWTTRSDSSHCYYGFAGTSSLTALERKLNGIYGYAEYGMSAMPFLAKDHFPIEVVRPKIPRPRGPDSPNYKKLARKNPNEGLMIKAHGRSVSNAMQLLIDRYHEANEKTP